MLEVLFSLVIFFHASSCISQNYYEAVYLCETKIQKGKMHDGVNTLYFGNNKSIYIHNDWPSKEKYQNSGGAILVEIPDHEGFPVYMNHSKNEMTSKIDVCPGNRLFIVKESIPTINWTIHEETKMIGDLKCVKASGSFGNREYIVWYTESIPVPYGPYKLNGLPGLIVNAHTKDNKVKYSLISYKKSDYAVEHIKLPSNGEQITWDNYEKFTINLLLKVESLSTATSTVTNYDPPSDYAIEKDKYKTISAYKASRN